MFKNQVGNSCRGLAVAALLIVAFSVRADEWYDESTGRTWRYDIVNGGAVIREASPAEGALVIPATIGGLRVRDVGERAFFGCDALKSVLVPDGVDVGSMAFMFCDGLTSVTIGDHVSLDKHAFLANWVVRTIIFGDDVDVDPSALDVPMGECDVTFLGDVPHGFEGELMRAASVDGGCICR